MPSEPEKPIEKLLREAAKERREQGGESWELHPANRRLLQQEVAQKFRTTKNPAPGGILNWINFHRWATALGGVAVLTLVALVAWHGTPQRTAEKNATLLARNDRNTEPALNDNKLSSAKTEAMDEPKLAQSAREEGKVTKKEDISRSEPRDSFDKDLTAASASALQKAKPAQKSLELDAERQTNPTRGVSDASAPTPTVSADALAFRQRYGLSGGGIGGGTLPQASPAPASAPASLTLSGGEIRQTTTPAASSLSTAGPEPLAQNTSTSFAATAIPESESRPPAVENNVLQYGYFAVNPPALAEQRRQISSAASATKSADAAATAPAPVLSYFHIEQSGTQLRVIDSDGSVYAGPLQTAAAAVSGRVAEVEELARSPRAFSAGKDQNAVARSTALKRMQDATATGGYAFQVAGTNRTLKQRVVFSGTITGLTNTNVQLRNEIGARSLATKNAHVSGKALIGDGPELKIEAAATGDK